MLLHANAVAENRATGIRTRGVDSNDAHGAIVLAIMPRQLINQRTLPRSRRPGEANHACMTGMREQRLQQFRPSRVTVLYNADSASQGADVAGAQLLNP